MKPLAALAVTVSAAVLAAAPVAESVASAAAAKTPVYTQADSGNTEGVTYHSDFKVRLKVCEDCGDRWSFAQRPDSKIVKLLRKTDVSSAQPPAVGGINTITWTYEGVGYGKTTMRLVERDPSQKVIKRFSLTVDVHPPLAYSG